jgi:neutral ceramidase
MALLAGAATVDITPPIGGLMDGYGNRSQPAQGVHDSLFARVLVLDDGLSACAIVGCDLLGMHADITAAVRERVSSSRGMATQAVLVAATHNPAGPFGLRGGMFSQLNETLAAELVDKIAAAIGEAYESRSPATLKLGSAHLDTISMNRRHPDWPIDPVLRVLLVDGEDSPIATLLNFACHATVMTGENLHLSAEFPGAACRLIQQETGAPAVYLNGACGNVNPVWIRQDFENVERTGRIVGGQALRTVGELHTLGPGQRVHNIRWDEFPQRPVPGRIVEARIRAARRDIEIPLRPFGDDSEYAAEIESTEAKLNDLPEGSDARRDIMARLTRLQNERWAAIWARRQSDTASQRTQVQAISLGEGLTIAALPGEFFVETGEAIREAVPGDVLIACYSNDYIGYVIPEDAYTQGGYESGVTFFAEGAEALVRDEAIALLREVAS